MRCDPHTEDIDGINTNDEAPVKVEVKGNVITMNVNLILDDNSEEYQKYIEEAIRKWEGEFKRAGETFEIKMEITYDENNRNGVAFVIGEDPRSQTEPTFWEINGAKTVSMNDDITSCESKERIINIIAHEFGHVLGAGEAYERVDGVEDSQTIGGVPEDSIMGVSLAHNNVTDFDKNLVIDAFASEYEARLF